MFLVAFHISKSYDCRLVGAVVLVTQFSPPKRFTIIIADLSASRKSRPLSLYKSTTNAPLVASDSALR